MFSKLLSRKYVSCKANKVFVEKYVEKSMFLKCQCLEIIQNTYRQSSKTAYSTHNTHIGVGIQHMRSNELQNAKPFSEIPGPKSRPLIGNWWRFVLPFGDFYKMDSLEMVQRLHQEYGDVVYLKGMAGNKPMLFISNPSDIEWMHRNEGLYPIRYGLPSFVYYRTVVRRDLFHANGGALSLQGEQWGKLRSVTNPIIVKPKNVQQYTGQMDTIANDLIDNITTYADQSPDNEMSEDFINVLFKWALDSIGTITTDSQIGSLKRHLAPDSDPMILISSVLEMFRLMYVLDVLPSFWRYYSTPSWKRYVTVLDTIAEIISKYIDSGLAKPLPENGQLTVIQQLAQKDKGVAYAMAMDMMTAGVDTTGRTLAAALYLLARNPSKHKELQKEACALLPTKYSPITSETLLSVPYLRAVIKETMRIAPIAIGNLRSMPKDIVLSGYRIPKGTNILSTNLALCLSDKHFPNAKEFLPERWLKSHPQANKNINPFVYLPFGYGPRSCIGKRIAQLELEVAILKIARNFNLSWRHKDMKFETKCLHGIADPLRITVTHYEK